MRSSTSSSERPVWQVIAVAALIVACYQAVVPRVLPDGGRGHDASQENLIKVQKLVYGHVAPTAVVVGSSKFARVQFSPETGIYNLSINGGGSLTGLDVIRQAGVHPRIVVIETGEVILREADPEFLDTAFDPVNYRLRGWLPVLQDAYQPGVLVNHVAQSWANSHVVMDDRARPELLRQLVAAQAETHAKVVDPLAMGRVIHALRSAIDALHAAGTTVVFVEPPEDVELWGSPASTSIRRALHGAFADVLWYPDPDLAGYQTSDAVHLDHASAERFATALASWLASVVVR